MKYVVVDLEMNMLAREFKAEREICRNELIQIGAVLLDERYQEIGSFTTLVKPAFNSVIERKIIRLTGIDMDMLENAPDFATALDMFFKWCDSVGDEIAIMQWSESDFAQIAGEMKMKNYYPKEYAKFYEKPWEDIQKEFDNKLGVDRQLSLVDALNYAGIDFQGKQHDALFDARNTAILLDNLRTPEKYKKALAIVEEVLSPKEDMGTLGEMFDFSKLVLGN